MSFTPPTNPANPKPLRRSHKASYATASREELTALNAEVLRALAVFHEIRAEVRRGTAPDGAGAEAAGALIVAREDQEKALGGVARPARGWSFQTPPLLPFVELEKAAAKGQKLPPLNRRMRRALIARQRRGENGK